MTANYLEDLFLGVVTDGREVRVNNWIGLSVTASATKLGGPISFYDSTQTTLYLTFTPGTTDLVWSAQAALSDVATRTSKWRSAQPFATATTNKTAGDFYFQVADSLSGAEGARFAIGYGNDDTTAAKRRRDFQFSKVQTTNATPLAIGTRTLPDASVAIVSAHVTARVAATGASAGYTLRAVVKRHAGGVATLVGSVTQSNVNEDAGISSANATIVVSGNAWAVQVTGIAATTIDWAAHQETALNAA